MDDREFCDLHAYVRDDETTLDDPYPARDAEAEECPDCRAILRDSKARGAVTASGAPLATYTDAEAVDEQ